jgi:K+-transporting ATPase A subunit
MLVFALLAVFIAGLMVGRTPEFLGRWTRPARPSRRSCWA